MSDVSHLSRHNTREHMKQYLQRERENDKERNRERCSRTLERGKVVSGLAIRHEELKSVS